MVTELVFMDPVTTICEACEGTRYSKEALQYTYHGKNVMEILSMPVEEAYEFFVDNKKIRKKLKAMLERASVSVSGTAVIYLVRWGEAESKAGEGFGSEG